MHSQLKTNETFTAEEDPAQNLTGFKGVPKIF